MILLVCQELAGGIITPHETKIPFHCLSFFFSLIAGSKESAISKMVTEALPGTNFFQVYENNVDENSFTPNVDKRFYRLMTEVESTLFINDVIVLSHQHYLDCKVSL